jgi:PAS domain-containing protein
MPAASACQVSICAAAVRARRAPPPAQAAPAQSRANPVVIRGMSNALAIGMADQALAAYEIDTRWRIVEANEAFCRTFHSTRSSLVGRDVRDLLRADWRADFRSYVARALVGVGAADVTLPLVAPCGLEGWFKHFLEPLITDGHLAGYHATIEPYAPPVNVVGLKRWWVWRPVAAHERWISRREPLAEAS